MTPDDRKSHRHKKAGDIRYWRAVRECQFNYLKDVVKLDPSHKFLDIGCGTLRGGIPVIDYLDAGNYYGIDIQKNVLEEAEKEVIEEKLEHKKPHLIHFTDFVELTIDTNFDVMWSWLSMWYLEEEELKECFKFVKDNLLDNGVFYFNTGLINDKGFFSGSPATPPEIPSTDWAGRVFGRPKSWYGFSSWYRPFKYFKKLADENDFLIKNLDSPFSMGLGAANLQEAKKPMLKLEKKIEKQ